MSMRLLGMMVWASLGATVVGCSTEVGLEEDALGVATAEIRGGTSSTMIGVVYLETLFRRPTPTTEEIGRCSGVMINDVTILTAAHCVPARERAEISAVYKMPNQDFVCLTGGPVVNASGSPVSCQARGAFQVHRMRNTLARDRL